MRASNQAVGASRRRPREKRPSFASAVATGAVLAAVVAEGGVLLNSAGDGDNQVTQLDTGGAGSDDGLVEQIPDLTPSAGGVVDPAAPGGPTTAGSPTQPSTGAPAPAAVTCPTFAAPATVAVNTVYPGGGTANTVPVASGTLRATGLRRVAGCPGGRQPGGAVAGRRRRLDQCRIGGSGRGGHLSHRQDEGDREATNKPLLGLLGTPVISGKVTATPVAKDAPCQPTAAVPVQLDLLGSGTVELAPGTWTFSVVGRSLLSSKPASVVVGDSGGPKSVALVAN